MAETPVTLRWEAYEHDHIERSADWYWALGIVTVSVVIISVLLHNILFGVVVVIAAFTIALIARTPPQLITFEISDRGIRTGKTLHRYSDIISFWVEDEIAHDRPVLLVDTTKWSAPNLVIPIEHIDPDLVRSYLQERATEKHMMEPLTHKIVEFFGF
ncbi:hypothetical protein FJY93_00440 [Candidatus Kaiserbacteria bacterium]|nr:hypothetical protein [Candidatus Kaiserbacteria bacterium]